MSLTLYDRENFLVVSLSFLSYFKMFLELQVVPPLHPKLSFPGTADYSLQVLSNTCITYAFIFSLTHRSCHLEGSYAVLSKNLA